MRYKLTVKDTKEGTYGTDIVEVLLPDHALPGILKGVAIMLDYTATNAPELMLAPVNENLTNSVI